MPDDEADFILDALKFVATNGWIFLPFYRYNAATAEWTHCNYDPGIGRKWLTDIRYTDDGMIWSTDCPKQEMPVPQSYSVSKSLVTEDKGQATDRLLRKSTDIYVFLCTLSFVIINQRNIVFLLVVFSLKVILPSLCDRFLES
ncbi:unnamed protein product [Trichobilharzia regenti]|nr:unnamed protein product [Trichobilharzia regenti]